MQVSRHALWVALNAIFKQYDVQVGGQLTCEDLRLDWQQTGFRERDLAQAIEHGVAQGLYQRTDYEGEPCLRLLTYELPRVERGDADSVLDGLLQRAEQARTVRAARRRRRTGPASTDRREPDTPED